MTVHITQLTGKMHVRGWTSGRSLTACTKFYCNNVMLQLRLEIYFTLVTKRIKHIGNVTCTSHLTVSKCYAVHYICSPCKCG